jgi:hypothetical protein
MSKPWAWAQATLMSKEKSDVASPIQFQATFAHSDDLPICNLVKASLSDGPWIAGGGPLTWYNQQPTLENDIDIFCKDTDQANDIVKTLNTKSGSSMLCQTANAVTFEVYSVAADFGRTTRHTFKGRKKVQVITCKYFNSAQEVIDDFDITVCKIVTDGYKYITGENTIKHIKNKELAFTKFTPNSMKRYVKYSAYGYTPSAETFAELVKFYSNNPTKYTILDDQYDHLV